MRNPALNKKGKLEDNFDTLSAALNNQRESMISLTLNLLQNPSYNKYINFASTQARLVRVNDPRGGPPKWSLPSGDPKGSLENLHNTYHGACGGQGHMSRVPVAAYDPIFWFHHWYVLSCDYLSFESRN